MGDEILRECRMDLGVKYVIIEKLFSSMKTFRHYPNENG